MADVFEVVTPEGVVLVGFDEEGASCSGTDAAIERLRLLVVDSCDAQGLPLSLEGLEPVELVQCCQTDAGFAVLPPKDYLQANIEVERESFYEGMERSTSAQQYAANEMSG